MMHSSDAPGDQCVTPPIPDKAERSYSFGSRKKRMSTTVMANRLSVLALGEQLRTILHSEGTMIKDRKYHLRTYKACVVGQEMVDWLLERGEVERREEGVEVMQKLLENGVIHHVCDDHTFKDDRLFYRFRRDDGSYQGPPDPPVVARGQRLYTRLKDVAGFLADRKYHLTTYKKCFVGNEFVDWLVANGEVTERQEGVELGRQLLDSSTIRHVCNDHHFKDDFLFYRFVNDDTTPRSIKERLGLGGLRREKRKVEEATIREEIPEIYSEVGPETEENDIQDGYQKMSSGPTEDSYVVINKGNPLIPGSTEGWPTHPHLGDTPPDMKDGTDTPTDIPATQRNTSKSVSSVIGRIPTWEELLAPGAPYTEKEVEVTSDAVGFGFIIRGRGPVYVHTVDQNGPAAAVGLTVGELLLEVNGLNVQHATHKEVAQIILRGNSSTTLKTLAKTPEAAVQAEGSAGDRHTTQQ